MPIIDDDRSGAADANGSVPDVRGEGLPDIVVAVDEAPVVRARSHDANRHVRWRVSSSSIPTLIFLRSTGAIVAANDAAARAYGCARQELLASFISDLVPPTGSLADRLLGRHHPKTLWTPPLVHRRKDGTTFLAEVGLLETGVTGAGTIMVLSVRVG